MLVVMFAGLAASIGCKAAAGNDAPPRNESRRQPIAAADLGPDLELATLPPDALCATRGKLAFTDGKLAITEPVFRAVAPVVSGEAAALRFTYHGPTEEVVALGSGQIRKQLGLKLRAADGCNLVYVMWRLDPKPGIEVSVKVNPGDRTHAECGTAGYKKLKPLGGAATPTLEPGASHTLQAAIAGDDLVAWIDGIVVWQGPLPASVRDLVGPAGLRSDNVVLDAEFLVQPISGGNAATPGCGSAQDG